MVTLYLLIVARLRNREKNVATLDKVAVDITVVLGTTSMPIHQVLARPWRDHRTGRHGGGCCEYPRQQSAGGQGDGGRERQPHCRQRGRTASPASRYAVNGRP